MNYDKVSYLFWSILVLFVILGTSIFAKYGSNLINDKTFRMFFGWYITLVILNLFNILLNLIYHYFMKNLQGPRGLKGEPGDRGIPGNDDKCGCSTSIATGYEGDGFSIDDADSISTRTIGFDVDDSIGVNFEIEKPPRDLQGKIGTVILQADSAPKFGGIGIDESRIASHDLDLLKSALEKSISNIEYILNEDERGKPDYQVGKLNLVGELTGLIDEIQTFGGTDADLDVLKLKVHKAIIRPFYFYTNTFISTNKIKGGPFNYKGDFTFIFQIADLIKSLNEEKKLKADKERNNFFNILINHTTTPTIENYYGANFASDAKKISVPDKAGNCLPFYQVFYDLETKKLIPIADVDQAIIDAANTKIATWETTNECS